MLKTSHKIHGLYMCNPIITIPMFVCLFYKYLYIIKKIYIKQVLVKQFQFK